MQLFFLLEVFLFFYGIFHMLMGNRTFAAEDFKSCLRFLHIGLIPLTSSSLFFLYHTHTVVAK